MSNALHIAILVIISIIAFVFLGIIRNKTSVAKILPRKYTIQLIQLGIIFNCFLGVLSTLYPTLNPQRILLTGSALIVAIVGFAAQTAIADVICGLLISINKPFEIGDRIIIDGLDAGIVEDITLRHIVVAIYDGLKIVVPNSQLNTKTVINHSFNNKERNGVHLQYAVGYDTDVQMAMDVIRDCVAESPYTLNVERNGIKEDSGPVYFLKIADSSFVLETTIFVPKGTSTYVATTDVNMRIIEAFRQNNIEIPYNYINVVDTDALEDRDAYSNKKYLSKKKSAPEKRHYRTNNLKLNGNDEDIDLAKNLADNFAKRQRLSTRDTHKLELMTEETIALMEALIGEVKSSLWIEGSGFEYRIHLSIDTRVGTEEYKRLIGISSSGKNEAISGLTGRIFDAMQRGVKTIDNGDNNQKYEWDINRKEMSQDEISESILAAIASKIKVGVTKEKVEFVVVKKQ